MTTPGVPATVGDLQAERQGLVDALNRFDPTVPDEIIARMRVRLEAINTLLRDMRVEP